MEELMKQLMDPSKLEKLKADYEKLQKERGLSETDIIPPTPPSTPTLPNNVNTNMISSDKENIINKLKEFTELKDKLKNMNANDEKDSLPSLSPEEITNKLKEAENKMKELNARLKTNTAFNTLIDKYIDTYVIEDKKEKAREELSSLMTSWFIDMCKGMNGNNKDCCIL
jgi:DNA repair exonuclease SbcCD ATPase subunit